MEAMAVNTTIITKCPHMTSNLSICRTGILMVWQQLEVCRDMTLQPYQPNPLTMYHLRYPHPQVQATPPSKVCPIICTCCLQQPPLTRKWNIRRIVRLFMNKHYWMNFITNDLLSPILIILVFELLKIIIIIAQSTTTTHIVEDPPITKSQNSIVVLQSAPHQVFSLIIISVCFRIKWLPLFNANEYNKKLCHFLNRHFW